MCSLTKHKVFVTRATHAHDEEIGSFVSVVVRKNHPYVDIDTLQPLNYQVADSGHVNYGTYYGDTTAQAGFAGVEETPAFEDMYARFGLIRCRMSAHNGHEDQFDMNEPLFTPILRPTGVALTHNSYTAVDAGELAFDVHTNNANRGFKVAGLRVNNANFTHPTTSPLIVAIDKFKTYVDQNSTATQFLQCGYSAPDITCEVVARATDWIMPRNLDSLARPKELEVGDVIRVGNSETGRSEVVVVLEKRKIDKLRNHIVMNPTRVSHTHNPASTSLTRNNPTALAGLLSEADRDYVPLAVRYCYSDSEITGKSFLEQAIVNVAPTATFLKHHNYVRSGESVATSGSTDEGVSFTQTHKYQASTGHTEPYNYAVNYAGDSVAGPAVNAPSDSYCYRISRTMDLTTPPQLYGMNNFESVFQGIGYSQVIEYGDKKLYPLYRLPVSTHRTTLDDLRISLEHIRTPQRLVLYGYSIAVADVGYHNQDTETQSAFAILRIRELNGDVLSNNPHCRGAFTMLHAPEQAIDGKRTFHQYDSHGLVTLELRGKTKSLRQLTFEFANPDGTVLPVLDAQLWCELESTGE